MTRSFFSMVGIATGIALVTALKISGLGFVNQTPEVPGQVPGQLPGHMGGGMGLGMIGTGGGAGSMSALPNWRLGVGGPGQRGDTGRASQLTARDRQTGSNESQAA